MIKKISYILGAGALLGLGLALWFRTAESSKQRRPLIPSPLFDVQYQAPEARERKPIQPPPSVIAPQAKRPVVTLDLATPPPPRKPTTTDGLFQSGRKKYQWKPDLWVVVRTAYREDFGEKLSQDSRYVFFRSENPPPAARSVVATVPGGTLKIATGRLKMGYKPGTLPELVDEFSLVPVKVFEDLAAGYFVLSGNNFGQIIAMVEQLGKDPRVTLSEVEILESIPTAQ